MGTGHLDPLEAERRRLAATVGCFTQDELKTLAGIEANTEEAWRKRGIGPQHVRFGTTILYPRAGVAEFLLAKTKQSNTQAAARECL